MKLSVKLAGAHRGSTVGLLLLQRFRVGFAVEYLSCFISVMNHDFIIICVFAILIH